MKSRVEKRCVTHLSGNKLPASNNRDLTTIAFTDPISILAQAKKDPMAAALECQAACTTLETGFHKRKIDILQATYGIAYCLMSDNKKWKEFCKDDFWKNFKQKPKNNTNSMKKSLRFAMKFVFQAKSKSEINRKNVYATMLQRHYDECTPAIEIGGIIREAGGIENMRQKEVKRRREELKNLKDQEADKEFFKELKSDNENGKNSAQLTKAANKKLSAKEIEQKTRELLVFASEYMKLLKRKRLK